LKKYKNKVYLLKIDTPDKRLYKIGSTRNSISKRIQGLQTGCPFEIKLVDYYESKYGQLVERSLHNRFSYKQTHGEWFELDLTEEFKFKEMCNKIEKINESLEKNKTI
jgi:hypothetical protein